MNRRFTRPTLLAAMLLAGALLAGCAQPEESDLPDGVDGNVTDDGIMDNETMDDENDAGLPGFDENATMDDSMEPDGSV